jgi:hypothetical protein
VWAAIALLAAVIGRRVILARARRREESSPASTHRVAAMLNTTMLGALVLAMAAAAALISRSTTPRWRHRMFRLAAVASVTAVLVKNVDPATPRPDVMLRQGPFLHRVEVLRARRALHLGRRFASLMLATAQLWRRVVRMTAAPSVTIPGRPAADAPLACGSRGGCWSLCRSRGCCSCCGRSGRSCCGCACTSSRRRFG